MVTLGAVDRSVTLALLDTAVGSQTTLYSSPSPATDWNGAALYADQSTITLGYGRHLVQIDRRTLKATDTAIPAGAQSDGPSGIVGLAPDGKTGFLVAVNGQSGLLDFDPVLGSWSKRSTEIISDSMGALTTDASGKIVQVGPAANGPASGRMEIHRVVDAVVQNSGMIAPAPVLVANNGEGGLAILSSDSIQLVDSNGTSTSFNLSTMAGSVLPNSIAYGKNAVWAVRMGTTSGTLQIDKIDIASGANTVVEFPLVKNQGGRPGLAGRPTPTVTYTDPQFTSMVALPDGGAYIATQCGQRLDGQPCAYAGLYRIG